MAECNLARIWKRPLVTLSRAAVFLLAAGCVALGISGYVRLFPAVPPPPTVPLDGLDPAAAQAVQSARDKVLASPRSAAAWGKLGMVLVVHAFPNEGTTCYLQAERLAPREPRWPYLFGVAKEPEAPETALPMLRRAVELAGDNPPAPRLRLARVLLEQGHQQEAEVQYRRALRPAGGEINPWAYLGLARLLAQRGELVESLTHLQTAAQSPATHAAAVALRAEVHYRLGDQAAAQRDLAQVDKLPQGPWQPDPFVEELTQTQVGLDSVCAHGEALLAAGRVEEALALFGRLTRDYPGSEKACRMLGLARLRTGDLAGAEQALATATGLAPDSFEAHSALGMVLAHRANYAAAAATFRRVLQLKPGSAGAHASLADCLNRQGDRAGAIGVLSDGLQYQPYNASLHKQLAELLALEGREAEAQNHRQRARLLSEAAPGDSNQPKP